MRKSFTTIKSLILLFTLFSVGIVSLTAQANLTVWHVGQAGHGSTHNHGFSNLWPCGYEYYIIHTGTQSSRDFTMSIKNEGDATLNLTLPLTLSAGSHSDLTILSQPTKSSLAPNEETHFQVSYNAPATYNDADATVVIQSDDPNNPVCNIFFDVGVFTGGGGSSSTIPTLSCDNTPISYGSTNNLGTVSLGSCTQGPITKTFTIRNPNSNSITLSSGCGNADIVSIDQIATDPTFTDFTVTSQPSSTIVANGSTTFTISFNPTAVGTKNALLCFGYINSGGTSGAGLNINLSGMAENCPPSYASGNKLTFGDPCKCDDPLNCTSGGITYFHDTLTAPASGTLASGLDLRITSASNFFIDVPCNGGTLMTPTLSTGAGNGTRITEVGTSGVYKLEFWRPSGAQPTLSVSQGGMTPVVVDPTTFQPICTVEACTPSAPIPTMSEWGLLIFGLLVLNLGVFFTYRRAAILG
ncbi:MAG: IPTL-CTERM sorting domain-containing protein [Bacteroidota bacterium]